MSADPEPLRLTDVVHAVGGWPSDPAAVARVLDGADALLPEGRETYRALSTEEVAALVLVAGGLHAEPRRRFRIATRAGAWLQRGYGVAALLLSLLDGCAASAPTLSPAAYPFHSVALPPAEYPAAYPLPSVAPQIELHWRLTVDSNRVQADGLIERQQESQITEVWLQLLGIDATGRTVSFTPPIRFAWRSPSALESFTIALKPRGGEQRYEVRLYMFEFAPQLTGSGSR